MPSNDLTTGELPTDVAHRNLANRAIASTHPVTAVADHDTYTVYRAAVERDGTVFRADIDTMDDRAEFDSTPRVSFHTLRHRDDAGKLSGWHSVATGHLSGPQELPQWRGLTTAFEAALERYGQGESH